MYLQVRKELHGLGPDAYKREAARRMDMTYDDYNTLRMKKGIKEPKIKVDVPTPTPVPAPIIPLTPTIPVPVTDLPVDDVVNMFKQVRKDHPTWTPAQLRREAASRMGVPYDKYLKVYQQKPVLKRAVRKTTTRLADVHKPVVKPPRKNLWQLKSEKKPRQLTGGLTDASETRDLKLVNPGHRMSGSARQGMTDNCTSCASTWELRQRGYDVVARKMATGQPLNDIYKAWDITGQHQVTGYHNIVLRGHTPTSIPVTRWQAEALRMPDGARGFMTVVWQYGGSHILNWEKRAGHMWYVDAQSGIEEIDRYAAWSRAQPEMFIARVDDIPETSKLDWLTGNASDGQTKTENPYKAFNHYPFATQG